MNDHRISIQEAIGAYFSAVKQSAGVVVGAVGSVALSTVQVYAGIASSVVVIAYTLIKTYFLIKNRGEKE